MINNSNPTCHATRLVGRIAVGMPHPPQQAVGSLHDLWPTRWLIKYLQGPCRRYTITTVYHTYTTHNQAGARQWRYITAQLHPSCLTWIKGSSIIHNSYFLLVLYDMIRGSEDSTIVRDSSIMSGYIS